MALFDKLFRLNQRDESPAKPVAPKPATAPEEKLLPFETWLAVWGADNDEIVRALGMKNVAYCDWKTGLGHACAAANGVFITDETGDGVHYVIGQRLPSLAYRTSAIQWLAALGKEFPGVCYCSACPKVEVYHFALMENGELLRAYASAQGEIKLNKGAPTPGEQKLGFVFPAHEDEEGATELTTARLVALANEWGADPWMAVERGGVFGMIERE